MKHLTLAVLFGLISLNAFADGELNLTCNVSDLRKQIPDANIVTTPVTVNPDQTIELTTYEGRKYEVFAFKWTDENGPVRHELGISASDSDKHLLNSAIVTFKTEMPTLILQDGKDILVMCTERSVSK